MLFPSEVLLVMAGGDVVEGLLLGCCFVWVVYGWEEPRQGEEGWNRVMGLEISLGGAVKVFWGASLIVSSWRYGRGFWQGLLAGEGRFW